jgi:hypothetical protein
MIEQVFETQSPVSARITELACGLRTLGTGTGPDDAAELIDQIRGLEELKSAAAAAQARVAAVFAAEQQREQRTAGVPAGEVGQGISAQIALARRDSPARGGQHLGLAQAPVSCRTPWLL